MMLLLASKKQLDCKYTRVIKYCNELKGLLIVMAIPFSDLEKEVLHPQ